MSGRLIRPGVAELAIPDTAATADPPVAGSLSSGWDPFLGESRVLDQDDGTVADTLVYQEPIRLPAQFENNMLDHPVLGVAGAEQQADITCTFVFDDLEELGLVDADSGEVLIRSGTKLLAIFDANEELIQRFRPENPLFALQPLGYGPGQGGSRNLLRVDFATRQRAPRSV